MTALGEGLLLSIVSRLEMEGGVDRVQADSGLRRALLDTMLGGLEMLPFDAACADASRAIVDSAKSSRRELLDRMIAAQALVHRATLVTLNGADIRDVAGLDLLEWGRFGRRGGFRRFTKWAGRRRHAP